MTFQATTEDRFRTYSQSPISLTFLRLRASMPGVVFNAILVSVPGKEALGPAPNVAVESSIRTTSRPRRSPLPAHGCLFRMELQSRRASPLTPSESSRPLRRRRHRRRSGTGPSEPSDHGGAGGSERGPESETMLNDPVIEPTPHHPRSGQAHPSRLSGGDLPPTATSPVQHDRASDPLVRALKALIESNKEDSEWNSRKGPEKGIRWKSGAFPPAPH